MITSLAKGRTFTKLIRLYLFITAKLKVKYYRQFFFSILLQKYYILQCNTTYSVLAYVCESSLV